jgi:hypothetical protein
MKHLNTDSPSLVPLRIGAGVALLAANAALALPLPHYAQDFQGIVGPEWSSTMTSSTPTPYPEPIGERRFLGQFGGADRVTLTLAGLPAHDWARVAFDLYLIRTWDGSSSPGDFSYGDDRFRFGMVGAQTLLDETFSNGNPAGQSFGPSPSNDPMTGAAERYSLGYWFIDGIQDTSYVQDAVYRFEFTFAHSASDLHLWFQSQLDQGADDESWGLDNVAVWLGRSAVATAVPEPSSLVLVLLAAGALGAAAWRRPNC